MQKVTWTEVEQLCTKLCSRIKTFTFTPTAIYGIPRGGLIPSVILSHLFQVPLITDEDTLTDYIKQNKLVFVVDDINDTGQTISNLSKHESIMTIVLYERDGSSHSADWIGKHIHHTGWLIFPWEQMDNATEEMINYLERRHGKVGV